MPDRKITEGGRWVTLVGKMGRCMKKVENNCRSGLEQLSSSIAWRVMALQTFKNCKKSGAPGTERGVFYFTYLPPIGRCMA